MKKIIIILISLISFISLFAENLDMKWIRTYGGTKNDFGESIANTDDKGFIITAHTSSSNGLIGGLHGGKNSDSTPTFDAWIAKLNSIGYITWSSTVGGSGNDEAKCIIQTKDGNYVFAGSTNSKDGDIKNNNGSWDAWVVKLNRKGGIIWSKTFGGKNADWANSIIETNDGGFVVVGGTSSNDGDVKKWHYGVDSDKYALPDAWIIKLDKSGEIEWERCIGGAGSEEAYSVVRGIDTGYLLTGYTNSRDGDVKGLKGGQDAFVAKVENNGDFTWVKTYGGSRTEVFYHIDRAGKNGYVVCGSTNSNYEDNVPKTNGGLDAWVLKIDINGQIMHNKTYGGSRDDEFYSVLAADNGFVTVGYTNSKDGDISKWNPGYNNNKEALTDGWFVKIDSTMKKEWDKCIGGSGREELTYISENNEESVVVIGSTDSSDGDFLKNNSGMVDITTALLFFNPAK